MIPKPILVTGSYCSGSTWIGRIIRNAPKVRYIHEPFNILPQRPYTPFKFWFEHLTENTHIVKQNQVLGFIKTFIYERMPNRTVLKDPMAVMSAEWLYKNLDCDVIISIRHPAAFVASLKVRNWYFDFNNFLNQKELMSSYLYGFESEISDYAANPPDLVSQGILLWNCIYSAVRIYRDKYRDQWQFISYEELSAEPLKLYEMIFNKLNLEFTSHVKNMIIESTTAENESEYERNSLKNITAWKERLTAEEIYLVKKDTSRVWQYFYSEKDWL
jgi:hypothetical protein